jgi:hypothetical protein
VATTPSSESEPLNSAIEREANLVANAVAQEVPVPTLTRSGLGLTRQTAPEQPIADVAAIPWSRYVDKYQEVYYDLDYMPAKPGHLSKWLRVKYTDGALIDLNIDEITESRSVGDALPLAMKAATLGRGGRIFPSVLNRDTTPRLYAARRQALITMDEYNVSFITASMPAVLFVITMAATPVGGTGLGTATRRAISRRPPSGGSGAALKSADEIGVEIGTSVAGKTTGKMAGIAQQVSAKGLSQEGAATATESAVRTIGLRTGPRVPLPDGSVVVTSVQPGAGQPVLVVRSNGTVFTASADLVIEGFKVIVRNVVPR